MTSKEMDEWFEEQCEKFLTSTRWHVNAKGTHYRYWGSGRVSVFCYQGKYKWTISDDLGETRFSDRKFDTVEHAKDALCLELFGLYS